jgi:hypothetical protein
MGTIRARRRNSTVLPPVLEVYVLWHPADDATGRPLLERLVAHFHGNAYSGLLGGAIEVFARSQGWLDAAGAPRPLPPAGPGSGVEVPATELTAVIVWMGLGLARAAQAEGSPWAAWLQALSARQNEAPQRMRLFPVRPQAGGSPPDCRLQELVPAQAIIDVQPDATCRDLAQGITQWAAERDGSAPRLSVFISHTKHDDSGSQRVANLIAQVRARIDGASRLGSFFDSNALQPGADWAAQLREGASRMALLALRTDLYASREWCQREMLLAKRHGVPVVVLDAPLRGEDRGSFLMDNVTRIPVRAAGDRWVDEDIDIGLARLVDACLQRELWRRQCASPMWPEDVRVDWWSPHAPEPATLVDWLDTRVAARALVSSGTAGADADRPLLILHPDPPLGPEERDVLDHIARLAGGRCGLDIVTPRLLAARGAGARPRSRPCARCCRRARWPGVPSRCRCRTARIWARSACWARTCNWRWRRSPALSTWATVACSMAVTCVRAATLNCCCRS